MIPDFGIYQTKKAGAVTNHYPITKKHLIIFLVFSFVNYSCYSYYEIKDADPKKASLSGVTKVELKNKRIIELDEQEFIEYLTDTTIIVKQGSNEERFNLSEISKVYETRFDLVSTLFASAGVLFISVLIFGLLMDSFYSPGG